MTIDEVIKADKKWDKWLQKYNRPLLSKFGSSIPKYLIDRFIKQADVEELALFYFSYCGFKYCDMGGILLRLERTHNINVPPVFGIYNNKFWDEWTLNHIVEIMDQGQLFGRA